jgi:hypothetical protein
MSDLDRSMLRDDFSFVYERLRLRLTRRPGCPAVARDTLLDVAHAAQGVAAFAQ